MFDIDWQGTQQLKNTNSLLLVTIFILPPNIKILKERLLNRHENQEKRKQDDRSPIPDNLPVIKCVKLSLALFGHDNYL